MHFPNAPAYSGSINMVGNEGLITLGLMQELVTNQGDAWNYMLDKIHVVFENLSKKNINIERLSDIAMFKRLKITDLPPEIIDWVGLSLFISVKKLALRTAEMHVALGSDTHETAFTPSSYNGDYSVWLKNRLLYQFQNRLNIIENRMGELNGLALELAHKFLDHKKMVRTKFVDFDWTKMKSERIRIHGDYHLGQVLVNGEDFYILDFEGEPESTIQIYRRIIAAFESGDLNTAREEQFRSVQMIQVLASFGYMGAARSVLEMLGAPIGPPRLPNHRLDDAAKAALKIRLQEMGFFEWIR